MKNNNVEILQEHIGKTIKNIVPCDIGDTDDEEVGFTIEFTDGTSVDIGAESGGGFGYITFEKNDRSWKS